MAHALGALMSRVGISRRELDDAIADGAIAEDLIVATPRGSRKIADLGEAELQLREWLRSRAAAKPTEGFFDLEAETAKRMHFAALREELRYRQEAGDLLDRTAAERAFAEAALGLRDRIMQVPGALAADLAAMDDAFTLEALLREHLELALRDTAVRVGSAVIYDGSA